jgi:hypothetical protein
MKVLLFPIVSCIWKDSALFQGFQASAGCLYDNNSAKLMITVERGLSGSDRKKPTFSERRLSRRHSASNLTLVGPGLKTRLQRERPASWGAHLKNKINLNYL